jgi:6-phosphogluconolactonase
MVAITGVHLLMRSLHRCLSAVVSLSLAGLFIACSSQGGTTISIGNPIPTPTAKAKFAYTGNQGASLSGYSVNTSTGALTALNGFPLTLGLNPTALTHDPQNRFLIVSDIAAYLLHVFTINSTTGALVEVSPSPYATIGEPVSAVVTPDGTRLYVVGLYGNQIGAYNLSATGVLTPIPGEPFSTNATGNNAHTTGLGILTDAAGRFLYVQDEGSLYTFSIDSNSGALTLLQTIAGPDFGFGLAIDPSGSYIYAVGSGTNSILAYSINATTHLLAQPKSSPMAQQNGAYTISISPTGQFAYTIENNNDLVSYALNNGTFTQVGTVYPGVFGEQIGIDPSGSFVYVPQACTGCSTGVYNVVNEFSVGSTGALTRLPNSPVAAGVTPWGITITSQ